MAADGSRIRNADEKALACRRTYLQAPASTSQLAAANDASTSTNAIAETAAAASVSLERRSRRFQTACSVAAPSASASAESATYALFKALRTCGTGQPLGSLG